MVDVFGLVIAGIPVRLGRIRTLSLESQRGRVTEDDVRRSVSARQTTNPSIAPIRVSTITRSYGFAKRSIMNAIGTTIT